MPVTDGHHLPDPGWPVDKTADGSLESVRRFLNTVNLESGADRLGDVDSATTWLLESHDVSSPPTQTELRHLIRFREATRHLVIDDNQITREEWAASTAGPRFTIDPQSLDLQPLATGLRGVVAHYAKAVTDARSDGSWVRLKACANPACLWAFYDRSRNRSGNWCSMDVCGSRSKMRTYRAKDDRS